MNESAVMPIATIRPAMPGNVRVKPTPWPSRSTRAYVRAVATSNDPIATRPSPR
jgi:hypothetical protein